MYAFEPREPKIRRWHHRPVSALACAALCACVATWSPAVAAASRPAVSTPAATIVTGDGIELWSSHPDQERRVASTIKLLNALVVRENADLDETVVVTREAEAIDDGEVGLVRGQKLTVRQLLNIMLIVSANDAAEALAIHVAGGEKKFVRMMNAKARTLGLENTKAADPHGLSKRERSSAGDLAIVAREVLKDPELRKIVKTKYATIPQKNGSHWHKRSTDRLLGSYRGIEGLKTGFTNPAGYCFVGAAERDGVEVIGVVLGGGSSDERWASARRLLDWGFAHARRATVVSRETTVSLPATSPVEGAACPAVIAHPERGVALTVPKGGAKVTYRVREESPVELPVGAGQRVGTLEVVRGTRVLGEVPLLAVVDVAEPEPPASTVATMSVASDAAPQPGALDRLYAAVMGLFR